MAADRADERPSRWCLLCQTREFRRYDVKNEWAQDEFSAADLCLALGTSLRIEPVGCLPLQAKRFVIVNLQATPFDEDATLIIRSRVDEVIDRLLYELHIYDQVGDDWAKPTYPVGTKVAKEFDGVCELVRHCLFL